MKTFSVLLFFYNVFLLFTGTSFLALPNLGVFAIFSFVCRYFLIIVVCSNILREGGEQI